MTDTIEVLIELLRQWSPAEVPWRNLPFEVTGGIMCESYLSNFGQKQHTKFSPPDPLPDLAFMNVASHTRKSFNKTILADSVVVVVRCHICDACNNATSRRYRELFSRITSQPWATILPKASTVTMTVRCLNNVTTNFEVATLYVPQEKLNLLALSQMFLAGKHDPLHRNIMVNCSPISMIGARLSIEVLKLFARLLHSVSNGLHFVFVPGDASLQEYTIGDRFTTALQRNYPAYASWAQANPMHQSLLREFQVLLDTRSFAIRRIAEVAAADLRSFWREGGWDNPRSTEAVPVIPDTEMEDFTYSQIHGNCLLFPAIHGLSDYLIRNFKRPSSMDPFRIANELGMLSDVSDALERGAHVMTNLQVAQEFGRFRKWGIADVSFLIHFCAVIQAHLRFKVISATYIFLLAEPLHIPMIAAPIRSGKAKVWRKLGNLENLHRTINELRNGAKNDAPFAAIDVYEIPDFIERMRNVMWKLHWGAKGMTNDEWYDSLGSPDVFKAPTRLFIPTIAPSDWDSVRTTFDEVNDAGRWCFLRPQ